MKLINIGDCLPCDGEFKIHSHFKNAVNFTHGDFVISIVNAKIGAGPINLVVDDFEIENINSLKIFGDTIRINDVTFNHGMYQIYPSKVVLPRILLSDFINKMHTIIFEITIYFHSKSLGFLFYPERKQNFISGFDRAFVNRIEEAISKIKNGNILGGVEMINGLGAGLTPSGDDFISGMLAAMYCWEKIALVSTIEERERIFEIAKSGNLISNTFMYFPMHGFFFERFSNFVISLLKNDANIVVQKIRPMLEIGDTSGADLLSGFLWTLSNFCTLSSNNK